MNPIKKFKSTYNTIKEFYQAPEKEGGVLAGRIFGLYAGLLAWMSVAEQLDGSLEKLVALPTAMVLGFGAGSTVDALYHKVSKTVGNLANKI